MPFDPTKYIPLYGGVEYHDYHHFVGGHSQSNFSSVFTFCDYIYGTDRVRTALALRPTFSVLAVTKPLQLNNFIIYS